MRDLLSVTFHHKSFTCHIHTTHTYTHIHTHSHKLTQIQGVLKILVFHHKSFICHIHTTHTHTNTHPHTPITTQTHKDTRCPRNPCIPLQIIYMSHTHHTPHTHSHTYNHTQIQGVQEILVFHHKSFTCHKNTLPLTQK